MIILFYVSMIQKLNIEYVFILVSLFYKNGIGIVASLTAIYSVRYSFVDHGWMSYF